MTTDINRAKDDVRQRVWSLLDARRIGRSGPVHGKIPDFHGADRAALRLAGLEDWARARVVKSNPDKAQAEVRAEALAAGKLLYMAVSKMATPEPFYELDPAAIHDPVEVASTGRWAASHAPHISVERMRPVDVVVCGSVAVNRAGVRLGKGAGYSDIEMGLLADAGLIGPRTLIVTTVHQLQVVDEELPDSDHDASVDVIVTPEETILCPPRRRPRGILWEDLQAEKIQAIPALRARRPVQ